eukprot:TRINITY_DN8038_c0_g1_i1.p1 TRINITY_DN8038_c0_g1~~TRINITY_DN8038_c0_g1_i1.p1  ORF type:complete len:130 (-),score=35.80 TRINITY_DN8038_c0_g1_i1:145-534(-)
MADAATKKAAMKRKSSMTGKRKSKANTKSSTPSSPSTPSASRDPQPPNVDAMANLSSTQKDWLQREWIEHVNLDLKKIVEFLNIFESSTKNRLATINTKLAHLERQMDFLEAQASSLEPLLGAGSAPTN